MRVVLFDIDGTLLSTGGAGRRAMEAALTAHFGTVGPSGYRYDGKTDPQIARDLMRAAGFADADIDGRMPALLATYVSALAAELRLTPNAVAVHDGVVALLAALEERHDIIVGLLTGNIETGARAKLGAASLAPSRFRVGAFGSDHEQRHELPAIARLRASALVGGDVPGEALVIIGDTPADMTCGRDVGARAIGVTTGQYRRDDLVAHDPVAVFDDLADTPVVMDAILGT